MNIYSVAFFRHPASAYEHPNAGESQGRYFVNYLRVLVRAFHACFAGGNWKLVVHHDDRAREFKYWRAMERMAEQRLLDLLYFGHADTLCGSMLWRLAPAFPECAHAADRVICRDVDHLPTPKERRMADEWVLSGRPIHVIHDSQSHSGYMGGTFSVFSAALRVMTDTNSLLDFMRRSSMGRDDWNQHGADQRLLNECYSARMGPHTLLHELHHMTGLNVAETRTLVSASMPADIDERVAIHADGFTNGVGLPYDVERPYAFYNSLGLDVIRRIEECEKS